MNIIEPITHVQTTVSQRFEGTSHNVPEWPGYTHKGKPVVITRVTISHRVTEAGVSDPQVYIAAHVVKKDGTLSAQAMDTQYGLSDYGSTKDLREELITEFGSDVLVQAVQIFNKLYT